MSAGQRVALVTGANRGLGLAIVQQLASRGIHVVVTARHQDKAAHAASELHRQGFAVSSARIDVTDPASISAAVAAQRRIDILINNAGITDSDQRPSSITAAEVTTVLETNLLGAWRCAAAVIPGMRTAGYGRIVNISSRLASLTTMTDPSEPAYRISKTALNALTRVLAAELHGTGILVNCCSPGWVRTDLGGPNAPATVEQGARTPTWLATLPIGGPTGGFFADQRPTPW